MITFQELEQHLRIALAHRWPLLAPVLFVFIPIKHTRKRLPEDIHRIQRIAWTRYERLLHPHHFICSLFREW